MIPRRRIIACGLFLPIWLLGCDDETDPDPAIATPGTYVGAVEGTDIRVGIVTGKTQAVAFFCGGASSLETTRWLRGDVSLPQLVVSAEGWKVDAIAGPDSVSGKAMPGDGRALAFTAKRVADDGSAGLYEMNDAEGRAGVVVFSDDAMQGAFIRSTDGRVSQIVPIKVGRIEIESGAFAVRLDTRDITVRRIRLE